MARAHEDSRTLRFSRGETARVIVALLLSALLHLGIWAGYHTGNRLGWWQKWQPLAWLHLQEKKFPLQARMTHEEEPTIYVDVSHADADAPEHSKFYSNKNSRAANAEVAAANAPKINGRQTNVPKTEDVPKPVKRTQETSPDTPKEVAKETAKPDNARQVSQLQPSMPPPSPAPMPQADAPEPPQTPGETDLPRPRKTVNPQTPVTTPTTTTAQAQPARPRTLKQALAQRDQIPGQQMQQDGGVPRHAFTSSLDAKATPFGDYDAAIIEAVSQRWYDLLDSRRFAEDRTGKVTLRFKLKSDGSVIEMQTLENTVGELLGYLCQESIEEAAPFAKWPPDMVRMIGENYRVVTFTFYYY